MVRSGRSDPDGSEQRARLAAARNESESFQVAVHADGGRLTDVDVSVSALDGPGGATIAADRMTLYREHFVRIRAEEHSPGPGVLPQSWFPDALVPFLDPETGEPPEPGAHYPAAPFDVPAGRTQPVWVDVHVPAGTPAGAYAGTWKVTSDQGNVTGQVELTVWDFALSQTPAEDSSFGVYKRFGRTRDLLLEYDVQPTPVRAGREDELESQGLQSVNLGFWSGATYHDCRMDPPPSVREIRRAARRHEPDLRIYNYTADEISRCKELYPRVERWSRRLHRADVEQLITMVPEPELLDNGAGDLAVDIWPILPIQFREDLDPDVRQEVVDKGGEMWSYQALVQGRDTPSWQIDFPPANYRILPGFLNQRMDVTGNLYWTVDYWQRHPWRDVITDDFGCCYPGDGVLVYPGRQAGVVGTVPSMRLAYIRDGFEDYAYVQILRDRGMAGQARRIIEPAATSWREWTQDPKIIAAVRADLAAAIEDSNP